MRDGFHPDYHDERFYEDECIEHDDGPAWKPYHRSLLDRAEAALERLRVPLALALATAIAAGIAFALWPRGDDPTAHGTFPPSPRTVEIQVPVPQGWPDMPVTVLRPAWPPAPAVDPSGLSVAVPADVPAPPGWTTIPLTRDDLDTVTSPAPVPAFTTAVPPPTAGARVTGFEPVREARRPLDALGAWLGAPTGAVEVRAEGWDGPRRLPLALYSVDADGRVADAMPSTMAWAWLAAVAMAAYASGRCVAWLASHAEFWHGLPWAGFETDLGRRLGGFAGFALLAFHCSRSGSDQEWLLVTAALASLGAGRAARARWLALALALSAAWLGLTVPFVEPVEALAREYGPLGTRAWDMLAMAATAACCLAAAYPWRDRSTHVTVQGAQAPLVQDVRVVGRG